MSEQLILPLSLRDDATFANFLATDEIRAQAKNLLASDQPGDNHLVFLWGPQGAGVSHLAQAVCHAYACALKPVQFLPLAELGSFEGESVLDGLDQFPLVCVEDLQVIGGNPRWEQPLFNLYNKMVARGNLLVLTADCPPTRLPFHLQDLVSRFSSGITFHFSAYSDVDKRDILRFRAAGLGIEMTEDVANYLLSRCPRHLEELMLVLKRLDVASLEAKRRITIPFIREMLGW